MELIEEVKFVMFDVLLIYVLAFFVGLITSVAFTNLFKKSLNQVNKFLAGKLLRVIVALAAAIGYCYFLLELPETVVLSATFKFFGYFMPLLVGYILLVCLKNYRDLKRTNSQGTLWNKVFQGIDFKVVSFWTLTLPGIYFIATLILVDKVFTMWIPYLNILIKSNLNI